MQTLLPTLLQLQNGKGLELVLPAPQERDEKAVEPEKTQDRDTLKIGQRGNGEPMEANDQGDELPPLQFNVNDRVRHPLYGDGTVIRSQHDIMDDSEMVKVRFLDNSEMVLTVKYAKLEKLD